MRPAPQGWAVFRWRITCEASGAHVIASDLLRDVAMAHTHFLRIDPPAGETIIRERVLVTGDDATWPLDASADDPEADGSLAAYIELGAEHIASGWDHLAFVLALLLLAVSLGEVTVLVTSFTVAHSITLGLAVLGVVRPEIGAVEVLIGFSIALVAVENSWILAQRDRIVPTLAVGALIVGGVAAAAGKGELGPLAWAGLALFSGCHFGLLRRSPRPARLRAALAFAFGLVHGFGFAGILMELELPATQLVPALFGFNVGVELGQLAVVAVVWPLFAWLARRRHATHRLIAEVGSAAIFALGLFWMVGRNF
jgi:hypothetical protein